ncbi:mechanosensitive ion channel family protein [Roseivirga sp. BDSF3-8]|uniref:mechanosensitive ion channel family protein n=1 Tax=Roseivirga sp. BDSF3-8 TaxID=3241598 RepID=UPI0035317F56
MEDILEQWDNLSLTQIWERVKDFFSYTLFNLGESEVSLLTLIYFVLALVALFTMVSRLQRVLVYKILTRYRLDIGVRESIGTIFRYITLILGFFIIISSIGIDLSTLSILAGALGVGIGFGLQNITNNFISGIIILFERPIKIGDRIEVGDINGDVVNISARSTTVVTNDNISVIVPNSQFIEKEVINWSHNDRMVRFRFPVGVSYREDPGHVRDLLLEVVEENGGVLKNPIPDVLFDGFGDSSLNFHLRVWTSEYINRPRVLRSEIYYAIFEKFREHGIEIPFPQRDLHLRSADPEAAISFNNGSPKTPNKPLIDPGDSGNQ